MREQPSNSKRFWFLLAMILAVVPLRMVVYFVPDDSPVKGWLWGFAPAFAVALFSGVKFADRRAAFLVPLLAMLLSDVALHFSGLAPFNASATLVQQATTYMFILGTALVGRWLRKRETVSAVAGGTLATSLGFWLFSNFVYWILEPSLAKNLEGLGQSYVLALPFLRNGLLGNVFYVIVLFGGFALLTRIIPGLREKRSLAPVSA